MRLLVKLGLIALLAWAIVEWRHPHRTPLPFGTTDLSGVQEQLQRLPLDERELVEAYVRRSRGDVLTPDLADPDEPLTARSFGEAIALERRHVALQLQQRARQQARRAERDAALQPLRAALGVELLRREIVSADEALGRAGPPGAAKSATGGAGGAHPVLITIWRLRNTSPFQIEEARASVTVRKRYHPPTELGILDNCYFTPDRPLAAGESLEVRCSQLNRGAGPAERAYAAMDEDDFVIEWEPRLIRFPGGQTLEFRD